MGARVQNDLINWTGNGLSIGAIAATFMGYLPPLAAGAAIIWYGVQIVESKTFQAWLRRRRARKIARLKRMLDDMKSGDD